MKQINRTTFLVVFFILVFIETVVANFEGLQILHYISKPLIVSSLLFYFISNNTHLNKQTITFTVLALIFSILGDVLLLFVCRLEHFFIAGLLSFLIAHIMYILVFFKKRNQKSKPYGFIILLVLYALGLFSLLQSRLGDLLAPVFIYMCVILLMSIFAFLRRGMVHSSSFNLVFAGAVLFMVSDSLLAINKFYTSLYFADFGIMFTYALAQLLLVFGLLKQGSLSVKSANKL